MGTVLVPFGGTVPQRSRFGVRIRKVYGADPRHREHRANMFRTGVLPQREASTRTLAKAVLIVAGVMCVFSTIALASGSDGATIWLLIGGAGLGWAVWYLLHKKDVVLPAVNPFEHDKMVDHFLRRSEPAALERLRYELDEDVRVKADFDSLVIRLIPEAVVTSDGTFGLDPFEWSWTIHFGQQADGVPHIRYGTYRRHHIFANKMGLSYVKTEWDFIDDELVYDGQALAYPAPRVIDLNQWVWRTIENLQVEEHSFTIHTVGSKAIQLPFVAEIPIQDGRGDEMSYRWYDDPPVQTGDPRFPWAPGGAGHLAPGQTAPTGPQPRLFHDPTLRQALQDHERRMREKAIAFVNTVNSLRHEWEAAH